MIYVLLHSHTRDNNHSWTDIDIRVYLDEVPAYWQLPACALTPVSTVVRDMSRGCGDGGRLTSYACFCTASHRKARWDISTAVAARCGGGGSAAPTQMVGRAVAADPTTMAATAATTVMPEAARKTTGPGESETPRSSPQDAVSSALGVFEAYCSIGVGHGIYEPGHKPGPGESPPFLVPFALFTDVYAARRALGG